MSAFFRPQTPRCALRRHELRLATVGAIFGLYFRYLLGILGWRLLDWEATSPDDRGSPRMQHDATGRNNIFFLLRPHWSLLAGRQGVRGAAARRGRRLVRGGRISARRGCQVTQAKMAKRTQFGVISALALLGQAVKRHAQARTVG